MDGEYEHITAGIPAIKSEDKRVLIPLSQPAMPARDSGVPKVVFEIEQNGKMLELVRVPSTEHSCSNCLLSSGDYQACAVCEALTNWETRGGRYIFKEKEGSNGR